MIVKTKSGVELEVVSNATIDNTPHLICKLPHNLYYQSSILYKYIIIPAYEVSSDNGLAWCEVIPNTPTTQETPQSAQETPLEPKT